MPKDLPWKLNNELEGRSEPTKIEGEDTSEGSTVEESVEKLKEFARNRNLSTGDVITRGLDEEDQLDLLRQTLIKVASEDD